MANRGCSLGNVGNWDVFVLFLKGFAGYDGIYKN